MGKVIKVIALLGMSFVSLAAQQAIYPDAVIADHQVGLFTNRQAWPPQLLQTTLTPTATSVVVGTSTGLVTPTVIQIRDEIIKVSSESAGTITVWSVSGIQVDDCTNASPIVVTTNTDHNLTGAERVTITGVGGNTACNVSNAPIVRVGAQTFSLTGTTGTGAFSSTGTLSANGRGYNGTTAASHLAGSTVTSNVIAAQLTQMLREIQALETAGPATGGVAGSPPEIQLNIGGSHGVFTGFTYSGEYLNIPRSATVPATKGGSIVLEEPTGGVGAGAAGVNMDFDTGTGFRIYHVYDADLRMIYANFYASRRLDVEYDGNIIHHNDKYVAWKDSSGTEIGFLKLNGSNHFAIGPDANLPGTPDVWFYKDGTVISKLTTDSSTGQVMFSPGTDRTYQVGGSNAMWRRLWGESIYAGRTNGGAEVEGAIIIASGVVSAGASQLNGTTDFHNFVTYPSTRHTGSFLPYVTNAYRLGNPSFVWDEGYIKNLHVTSCTGCGAAGHPVVDTTSIVEDDGDPTKEIRFELSGLTTGTIRTLTPQNASYTIAGLGTTQTFTGTNTFNTQMFTNHILPTTGSSMSIGSSSFGSDQTYSNGYILDIRSNRIRIGSQGFAGFTDYHRWEFGAGNNLSSINNNSNDPVLSFDSTNSASFSPSTVDVDGVRVDADLLPYSNSDFFLGSTSYRWKELHADKGFFPSGVTAGVTTGSPGCTSGSPATGGDNGRLYWDTGTSTLYVCSNGSPVTVYP